MPTVTRRALLQVAVVLWLSPVTGCWTDQPPAPVRGLILSIEAATFTQIASFVLRTDDGTTLDFVVEGNVGITPSHMREHMTLAEPVTVTYRREDGLLIALRVDD